MITKVIISPKLDIHRWANLNLQKDWFRLQEEFVGLGRNTLAAMITHLRANKKRRGIKSMTGVSSSLEKHLKFYLLETAPARVSWGIGRRSVLNTYCPYWYVLNYGVKITGERFIPGGRLYRPVRFGDIPANPEMRGKGTQYANVFVRIGGGKIPNPIRPINYIQAGHFQTGVELRRILATIKRI